MRFGSSPMFILRIQLSATTPSTQCSNLYEATRIAVMNQHTKLPMPKANARDFAGGHQSGMQRQCACGNLKVAGGACEACRKQPEATALQRAAISDEPANAVPPIVQHVLRSTGQPLDEATRADMESQFDHDFSRVRVHTDAEA